MQMHICVFTALYTSQRLSLDQIKLKHYLTAECVHLLRMCQPEEHINTDLSGPAISPVNTRKPLWPLQRVWQQNKETQSWGDNQQKKSPKCFRTSNKHRHKSADLRAGDLSDRGRTHSMPLSPLVQWQIWQQVSVAEAQTECPPAFLPLKADGMKRWLVSLKSPKIPPSGFQDNIRLCLSNGLVKCSHLEGTG